MSRSETRRGVDFELSEDQEALQQAVRRLCAGAYPIATVRSLEAHGGVERGAGVVAGVAVPCPHCHRVNEVVFEPNGTVLDVRTPPAPRPLTQPCWN